MANGIEGATAKGAPAVELLMNSYNIKNNTSLVYANLPNLWSEEVDLYVVHGNDVIEGCYGFWTASPNVNSESATWCVAGKQIGNNEALGFSTSNYGVRPVVSLPSTTKATKTGNIWTVKN